MLPRGELPGWTGWLPPRCSKTSPELRKQLILDYARRLGKVQNWLPLAAWKPRLACGEHEQGLGVGAWLGGWAPEWGPTAWAGDGLEFVREQGTVAQGGLLGRHLGATARPVRGV